MKLIIEVDEELYEAYKGKPPMLGDAGMDMVAQAIANAAENLDNQRAVEDTEYCERYEPTYNSDDGSM